MSADVSTRAGSERTSAARIAPGTIQPSFEDVGEPLSTVTFVVVDLETTGGSPRASEITEIGAVKTRGGEVIGEYQTLVDPGMSIPPIIVSLTGITDVMVHAAPKIEALLPSFLEFLGDGVLVAHNAPFDVGFLKAACRKHGYDWPGNEIIDTVILARRATTKEEAPSKKLSTLARVFGTVVTPNHRALEDARATSEVLHGMLERMAAWGITHREDLDSLRHPMPERLRRKATMADKMPTKPGAYVFRDIQGAPLYVGTSKNLRARVKSYFTRGEHRRSIRDMLEIAVAVDAHPTATKLEANVLEIRLLEQFRPRYNRRSTRPERTPWVRMTQERYPRLSVVRSISADATHIGPMRSAADAQLAVDALQHAGGGVRTCTPRLPIVPKQDARACLLKDMGECCAPCVAGEASGYADVADALRSALSDDVSPVVDALSVKIAELSADLNYERAAALRDGVSSLVEGATRAQRLASLRRCTIVAARPLDGGWDLVAASSGRLSGTAHANEGIWKAADALLAGARAATTSSVDDSAVSPPPPLVEEQTLVANWLDSPGVRLLHVDGEWSQPVTSAGRHRAWVDARRSDHDTMSDITRR